MNSGVSEWISPDEAARWLDVPLSALQDEIAAGRIPAITVGRHVRIHKPGVVALASPTTEPLTTPPLVAMPAPEGPGHLPIPQGMEWVAGLTEDEPFEQRWPRTADELPEANRSSRGVASRRLLAVRSADL